MRSLPPVARAELEVIIFFGGFVGITWFSMCTAHLHCTLITEAGSSRVVGMPFTASNSRLCSLSDPEESLI